MDHSHGSLLLVLPLQHCLLHGGSCKGLVQAYVLETFLDSIALTLSLSLFQNCKITQFLKGKIVLVVFFEIKL